LSDGFLVRQMGEVRVTYRTLIAVDLGSAVMRARGEAREAYYGTATERRP